MAVSFHPFANLLSNIVDNRGRTCPTAPTGIPLIATNCVRNDLLYPSYETSRFVDEKTYQNWFRGHPLSDDLLFVTKGTPGRVCMVPDPVDFCIAQDMVAIRADHEKVYPRYLFALLRSSAVQEQIEQLHVGTLIPHFKKGDFDKLLLPVPERDVQEFIGDIYFELSAKIELNRRMNETLEAMARALFKSWFVDFDPVRAKAEGRDPGLPPHRADPFPDSFEHSALGEIPKQWKADSLGQAIVIHDAKRIPLSNRQRAERQGHYPYYGAAAVMDYVDDYLFDGTYVLVGEDGSVVSDDDSPILQYVWGKFWVNNHAHVLTGSNGISVEQLFLFLKTVNIRPYVTGAVQPKLNQGNLCRVPFVLPPESICESFAQLIGPIFSRIRLNAEKSFTLAALRNALLPKLISGELRVKDAQLFLKEREL